MPDNVHTRLKLFCGEEKYLKLLDKFQVSSRTEYELPWWIERLFSQFVAQDQECHSVSELVDRILEPRFFRYRCPGEGCTHVATYLDGAWGCGECGVVFGSTEEFFELISDVTARYPYRVRSYIPMKDGYEPAPAGVEHPNYTSLVEAERGGASI